MMGIDWLFGVKSLLIGLGAFTMGVSFVVVFRFIRYTWFQGRVGLLPLHVWTVALSYNVLMGMAITGRLSSLGDPLWRWTAYSLAAVSGAVAMFVVAKQQFANSQGRLQQDTYEHEGPRLLSELEKCRKWQFTEGIILLVIGVGLIFQSVYFQNLNDRQEECLATQFSEFNNSLAARAELSAEDSKITENVILRVAEAGSPEETTAALEQYVMDNIELKQDRADNPIPPFPSGLCE